MLLKTEIRKGAYCDSVVLMQLQKKLAVLEGIIDAGVVMGTGANKNVLAQSQLLSNEANAACPEDLLIVISAKDEISANNALSQIDGLINAKKSTADQDYQPRSLEMAAKYASDSNWVLISVNGKYAPELCDQALDLNKNVFLYSDNVSLKEESRLKQKAAKKGLMVMGPDCGTAIIQGVGLGFANHVARGNIGIVAASGTGLQAVTVALNEFGEGISQAIGTGGRDLKDEIGAITTRQSLQLLAEDDLTKVIVIISKPPSNDVARKVFALAQQIQKPVVVYFLGYVPPTRNAGNLHFALSFSDVATLAHQLVSSEEKISPNSIDIKKFSKKQRYLRGLFSGGTVAYETIGVLRLYLSNLFSNIHIAGCQDLKTSSVSQEHTLLDLGEDEFTVGRLHPMMDNDLRIRRMIQESNDPEVAVIMLDVVLGYGANPDPANELAAAIKKIKSSARHIEVIAVVIGTEDDPQIRSSQIKILSDAGAVVEINCEKAAVRAGQIIQTLQSKLENNEVKINKLSPSFSAINVGVKSFYEDLKKQKATAIQVEWSPPAGGNEQSINLLNQLKDNQPMQEKIKIANDEVIKRMMASRPILIGMGKAKDVIPGMRKNLLLHAGPPIIWKNASGPLRGAIVGALMFEGLAKNKDEAIILMEQGKIDLEPNHDHDAVGPMAGVISSSMSVYITRDESNGKQIYCSMSDNAKNGRGKSLRFGVFAPEAINHLHWMERVQAPVFKAAIEASGGIDIRTLLAQAIHMGDECHARVSATSLLYLKALVPFISDQEVIATMADDAFVGLNVAMAGCKAMTLAGHGVEHSTIVTIMARNGTEFGIKVSGLGQQWFTAPAPIPQGLLFPGFTMEDANPDIGDSAVLEVAGLGGMAMATAPAVLSFIGGTAREATNKTLDMYEITHAEHEHFKIPALDFRGTPIGIDIRKVVEKNILPCINTGIANRKMGNLMVGCGSLNAPLTLFEKALEALC